MSPGRLLDNLAVVGGVEILEKALGFARYGDPPWGATLTTLWDAVMAVRSGISGDFKKPVEFTLDRYPLLGPV